ncbi:MAG: DUF2284 domain-containing protein [Promethearchaeota archaeon]|nr:MAG: DUF2284 domain-containing protein [Candidatus Lokiarchaeota archaeon]
MPTIEINYEDIEFQPNIQELCNNPKYRCPIYNHSWGCPPEAPYLEEKIAEYKYHLLVYKRINIEKNTHNNALLKQQFEKEILTVANHIKKKSKDMLILWGGHCDVCYNRLGKKCTYDSGEPCRFPNEIRYSMEAVGINVDATVKKVGINLEWPPTHYIYKFGLINYNI